MPWAHDWSGRPSCSEHALVPLLRSPSRLRTRWPPQGRGFREPMEMEDHARGGDYESLPADRQGPGPAKCE